MVSCLEEALSTASAASMVSGHATFLYGGPLKKRCVIFFTLVCDSVLSLIYVFIGLKDTELI